MAGREPSRDALHPRRARWNARGARLGLAIAGLATVVALSACEPVPMAPGLPGGSGSSGSSGGSGSSTQPEVYAAAAPGDGTSMATAGASCWGILRDHPGAKSGTYWLSTPAMARPGQFFCDMTTEGGGWVLVARGRNGWTFDHGGQRSEADVRNVVLGSGAFAPAALGADVIDGLVNGADIAALSDGVRIERSLNTTFSSRQQFKAFPKFHRWSWAWQGQQLLSKAVVDGRTYSGSNLWDTYSQAFDQKTNGLAGLQGTQRLFTFPWTGNNDVAGFSYGKGVAGASSSSTNNLYLAKAGGYAMPFTRIWVRPRLTNALGFPAVPAAGLPAAPEPWRLNDRSQFAPWGVTGLDHANEDLVEPWKTNVVVVRAGGGKMFVGGHFTGVRKGPTGAVTGQRSLAAFDLNGNWISTFRPTISGHVWDLLYTADGRLIVAGDFTAINGNTNASGLAALDPNTGAVLTTFKARIRRAGGGRFRVRALAARGSWIYAAGDFNEITGGTAAAMTVGSAISVNATTGQPGTWKPVLAGGSAVRIRVNAAGTRVLMTGHFTTVNGSTNQRSFAITDIGNGANSAGLGAWKPPANSWGIDFQQAVADLGDGRIAVGGSQHDTQLWNANRTIMLDSASTLIGGDTQAIEVFDGHAFVGCHCGDFVYQGTNTFRTPTGHRSIDAINLVGMWNTSTWTYDPGWNPTSLKGANGEGVWAMDMDANGCLWVGGDLVRGAYSGNAATDYLGGFARFCPLDSTPPTTPFDLTVVAAPGGRTVSWLRSTDAGGAVTYDVIRNGRVVASTTATSVLDTGGTTGSMYTVRAHDARGNRSAAPAPVKAP